MLKVFLTNLGRYNEGALIGEWLELPISFADFVDVMERIGIDGVQYEEYFISDYDCDILNLTDKLGEYENIEALNYLAGKLDAMPDYEKEIYEAALETGEHCGNVYELIELTDQLDSFMLLSSVNDDDDLGRYYVEECCIDTSSMGALANYIDYDSFGRDIRLEEGGIFSGHGYIVQLEDSFCPFDLTDVPEEYKLTAPDEETEVQYV